MSTIDEIKNSILKQLEAKEKAKEDRKNQKQDYNKNRDLEVAKKCQQRYINTKKQEGKNQVSAFIDKENLEKIDNEIIKLLNKKEKNTRSDILNKAVKYYFENRDKTND